MPSYREENFSTILVGDNGDTQMLCNFIARITQETRIHDGLSVQTRFTITGQMLPPREPGTLPNINPTPTEPIDLPPVEIDSADFASMQWVVPNWGIRCVILPGNLVKDHMRAAFQYASTPAQRIIYKHLGWTTIDGKRSFLHAGGALSASGNDSSVNLLLPPELARFKLEPTVDVKDAARASLQLLNLAPPAVAWALLGATFAPVLGPCDFAVHVTGRTGTFKSELASLYQSHYGSEMDSRHLPGSWSSTANALEAQAFLAANVLFVVDDFIPNGTSWQVRAYQATADKIIRAQGNQAGRARLTDQSSLQMTMYPRGLILSTGEDVPEGHSVRARMMICELSPDDISPKKLSAAQKNRLLYSTTMFHYVRYLARNSIVVSEDAIEEIRNRFLNVGHTRTPTMVAALLFSIRQFLTWCAHIEVITSTKANSLYATAEKTIAGLAEQQAQYLEVADPVEIFINALRTVLASGHGHIRSLPGGIPRNPVLLGWTTLDNGNDMPTYKSQGPTIGWVNWDERALYIDINAGYNIIRKSAGNDVTLTKQTLLKRLKDAGQLLRTDDSRQRNTIRITAEQHPRQVIAIGVDHILDEEPNDER